MGGALAVWALVAALLTGPQVAAAQPFGGAKPVYIDPALGGWRAPAETLCFQAGAGEYYYVAGVYLGAARALQVVCQSRLTLRRFDRAHLGRFAVKLKSAITPIVEDLARRGVIDGVVLTFYCVLQKGNVLGLEVFESCLPAQSFADLGPVPIRIVERRTEVLPPP